MKKFIRHRDHGAIAVGCLYIFAGCIGFFIRNDNGWAAVGIVGVAFLISAIIGERQ